MNISNVTLDNLSNNISQNLNLSNLSDQKIKTLENSLNSSSENLYPFLDRNSQPILVITYGVPFTAVIFLKTKLSNLKTNPKTNEKEIITVSSSITYISSWLLINIFILLYLGILNPTVFSYNQVIIIVLTSGLLLFMFTLVLVWLEDVGFIIRRIHDFKRYIHSKFRDLLNLDVLSFFDRFK
ncbi:MAG: hypothetical protein Q8M95_12915 [Candidatus Methanoperedens sp.]|nr:hypothetical protein [Candidatus Methanoperedens sp.]